MYALWVHKMYFYVNLSCEKANLNKFGFIKWRVWLFFGLLWLSVWLFSAIFLAVFGLFYWRFGLFWKHKSGNPAHYCSWRLGALSMHELNQPRREIFVLTVNPCTVRCCWSRICAICSSARWQRWNSCWCEQFLLVVRSWCTLLPVSIVCFFNTGSMLQF